MPPRIMSGKESDPSKLELVRLHGKRFVGKKELVMILEGQHATPRQRILAQCYDCMGWYTDGTEDCQCRDCPLYGMMPYRNGKRPKCGDENASR